MCLTKAEDFPTSFNCGGDIFPDLVVSGNGASVLQNILLQNCGLRLLCEAEQM